MQINMAHLRERSTSGGWIDFAVFDAKSVAGTDSANQALLEQLTASARSAGLKVDESALAFRRGSRLHFFGSKHLVNYLSRHGVQRWTHRINP